MKLKKPLLIILVIALGAFLFVSGLTIGERKKVFVNPSEEIDMSLFSEVYYLLEENFPQFQNISETKILYGMIEGALTALDDPHTSFFDPEKSKLFLEDVSGEFDGVGIEIGFRDGNLQVISPLKDTPAYKAGIKSKDIIVAVDEELTEELTLEEVVSKIRGEKGVPVTLTLLRDGEIKDITVVRDTINIKSIEWNLIDGNTAHIQLYQFHEKIETEFSSIAREILNSPAEKIILDLRGNPGGVFDSAISVSSRFLEPGSVVVIETGANNRNNEHTLKTNGMSPVFLDYPLVVLIDEGSASAAEIVAGALKDQRSAPIVGMTSFGKGSIQRLHSLSDGSMVKITEKYFLTPKGNVINKEGIVPDFEVEITAEDFEANRDPQLEKALEIIKKM